MSIVKPIITINNDKYHTASIDHNVLARQSERGVQITVNVASELAALGYEAYLDFLQPNGVSYFKGPYDCSSGQFLVSIGQDDTLLDDEGILVWQFVLREENLDRWKSRVYKIKVEGSIKATSAAILPTLPEFEVPDPYPAANISVQDAGLYFLQNNVEDAMQIAGSQIGYREYTEENYVTDKESLTDSVDALDIALKALVPETGSDANAKWTKFPDGTLIINGKHGFTGTIDIAAGGYFRSEYQTVTPPVAFVGDYSMAFHLGGGADSSVGFITSNCNEAANVYAIGRTELIAVSAARSVRYIAIGRWK